MKEMARRRREKMGCIFSKGLIPYPRGGGVAILRVWELYSLFLGFGNPMPPPLPLRYNNRLMKHLI